MLFYKILMCCQRVGTDAQNLGVALFKFPDIGLKSLQLTLSDRGEIGKIEGEDHRALFQKFAESDLAQSRGGGEIWCLIADLQGEGIGGEQ